MDSTKRYKIVLSYRMGYIQMKDSSGFYFRDDAGAEFRIGDKIRIEPNMSYSDGRREFKIHGFAITEQKGGWDPREDAVGKRFEFVYAFLEENRRDAPCIHLNNLLHRKFKSKQMTFARKRAKIVSIQLNA